jgi:hypothetical protein
MCALQAHRCGLSCAPHALRGTPRLTNALPGPRPTNLLPPIAPRLATPGPKSPRKLRPPKPPRETAVAEAATENAVTASLGIDATPRETTAASEASSRSMTRGCSIRPCKFKYLRQGRLLYSDLTPVTSGRRSPSRILRVEHRLGTRQAGLLFNCRRHVAASCPPRRKG